MPIWNGQLQVWWKKTSGCLFVFTWYCTLSLITSSQFSWQCAVHLYKELWCCSDKQLPHAISFSAESPGSGPVSKKQGQQVLQGGQVWECHPVLHRGHRSVPRRAEDRSVDVLPESSCSLWAAGWWNVMEANTVFKSATLSIYCLSYCSLCILKG